MSEYSKGGIVEGPEAWVSITLRPGPLREAVDPDILDSYADECYLNRDGMCVRTDEWHRGVTIATDRWWVCPVHD